MSYQFILTLTRMHLVYGFTLDPSNE